MSSVLPPKKLFFHEKWVSTTQLRNQRKGKIKTVLTYFSRGDIAEYFRCKKQMFQFENFRVRKLATINALNFYITLCMAFLAYSRMKKRHQAMVSDKTSGIPSTLP